MKVEHFFKVIFKFLQASNFVLPNNLLDFYESLIGNLIYNFDKRGRKKVLKNLSIAFVDLEEQKKIEIARNFYIHLIKNIVEFIKLSGNERGVLLKSVEIENENILRKEFEKGKGLIIITAHLGNWELLGAKLVAEGYPLNVIAKDQEDTYLNTVLVKTREKLGMINISKKTVSYKKILEVLKKGEVVGLLADQNGGKGGVFVNFFGLPASTYKGPAFFAFRSESPALPVFCLRTKMNTHKIKVLPPINVDNQKEKSKFIFEFTQAYTSIIEEEIRKCPEQWLWLHNRWKTKP